MVKEDFWSSIENSLKIYKKSDFDTLWNQLYLPQAIREQMAMDRFGVVDSDKSNNNTSIRYGSSSNNTQVYK